MTDPDYSTIIVNEAIRLIQLRPEQAPRLFALTDDNRDHLGTFLPWVRHVVRTEDSRTYINETLRNRADGTTYSYGIEVGDGIVGTISLMNINDPDKTEIGYWIDKAHAGKGITTESVTSLTEFAFSALNLRRIMVRAVPDNIASNRVAEKAGYVFTGQFEDGKHGKINVWAKEN